MNGVVFIANSDPWTIANRDVERTLRFGDVELVRFHYVDVVLSALQLESETELAGTVGEFEIFEMRAAGAHGLKTFERFERTNEDGFGHADFACDDVEAEVHSINKIYVAATRFAVHDLGARRELSPIAVRGRIFGAEISFGFDNAAAEAAPVGQDVDENPADQVARDVDRAALIKFTGKRLRHAMNLRPPNEKKTEHFVRGRAASSALRIDRAPRE